ncbi:MAG: sulfotransferase [Rubrobacter sp.]
MLTDRRGERVGLPNFLLIGAQKAGTTALYHYLGQHPQVYMSPVKEPHFFTYEGGDLKFSGPGRGYAPPVTRIEDYSELFRGAAGEKALGEASTSYIYFERALERIRRYAPDARLIAVLRDPAERAYSNYLHCVRGGSEPLNDFEQALQAEETRIRDNWGTVYYYRQKGFYYAQLKRYYEAFEKEQIRVYLYEDLKEDPAGVVRDAFGHLGVDEDFVPDVSLRHNVSGVPRNHALLTLTRRMHKLTPAIRACLTPGLRRYIKSRIWAKPPPLSPEVRGKLVEGYKEDILKLEELIQRDLSRWLV